MTTAVLPDEESFPIPNSSYWIDNPVARCGTMDAVTNGYPDMAQWHRQLCPVTDGIIISGDLSQDPDQAVQQLKGWEQAGITHVLDTRVEWSDEELVELLRADLTPSTIV